IHEFCRYEWRADKRIKRMSGPLENLRYQSQPHVLSRSRIRILKRAPLCSIFRPPVDNTWRTHKTVCVVDRQLVCAGGRLARLLKGAQVSPRASAGGSEAGAAREIIPLPPQSRALSGEFPAQVPKVDIVLTGALDD